MPEEQNLYQMPSAEANVEDSVATSGVITETMLQYLKGASPWMRFFGILGFIGSGFMVLAGLIFTLVMAITGSDALFSGSELDAAFLGGVGAFGGVLYIALGAVYFLPARFVYRCGIKLRDYSLSHSEKDLEIALKNNRSLWKFLGIIAIVCLALLPVMIIIAMVVGISSYF